MNVSDLLLSLVVFTATQRVLRNFLDYNVPFIFYFFHRLENVPLEASMYFVLDSLHIHLGER